MRPDTKAKNMARGEARIHPPVDTNGKTPKVLEIKWNNFKEFYVMSKSSHKYVENPFTNGFLQNIH